MLTSRRQLEIALLSMTDESFGLVVMQLWTNPVTKHNPTFPDGQGGYTPESRASMAAVAKAADAYIAASGR
jgi:hypothetical protein